MTLVYTSGKYSGDVDTNIRTARAVAIQLWNEGYYVICPHLNTAFFEQSCKATYDQYIAGDLRMIDGVDALVMLPGWEDSKGANLERDYAIAKGIDIYEWPDRPKLCAEQEAVLEEAQRLVYGARQGSYGHPIDDFTRTAQIWSAIMGVSVSAEQVALCMVGVKISRECNKHKRDNIVDGAGYFATLDLVVSEREKRKAADVSVTS